MHPQAAERVRDRIAAEVVLPRIELDRDRAAHHVIRGFLDELRQKLFDPAFRIGERGYRFPKRFGQLTGMQPRRYVEKLRLAVLERLLVETDCRLKDLAPLVGYHDDRTMSDAYRRASGGLTPGRYREQQTRPRRGVKPLPGFTVRDVLAGFAGEIDRQTMYRMGEHLIDLAQDAAPTWKGVRSSHRIEIETDDSAELARGEAFWQEIRDLPEDEQRFRVMTSHLSFKTPALVQVLRQKSREEGRRDRRRGVTVAGLALEAVRALEISMLGDSLRWDNLHARSRADLGNALRLALDLDGADQAIVRAKQSLRIWDDRVMGFIYLCRAALRWYQWRLDEAEADAAHALELYDGRAAQEVIAEARVMRASILTSQGKNELAASELRAALRLIGEEESHLVLIARRALATALFECGELHPSNALLPETERLARSFGLQRELAGVRWLEVLSRGV